jgi:hypothetical protein
MVTLRSSGFMGIGNWRRELGVGCYVLRAACCVLREAFAISQSPAIRNLKSEIRIHPISHFPFSINHQPSTINHHPSSATAYLRERWMEVS